MRRRLADAVGHVLPKAVASVLAFVVVVTGVAWISDSVIFHRAIQAFAASAAQVTTNTPDGRAAPTWSADGAGSSATHDDKARVTQLA